MLNSTQKLAPKKLHKYAAASKRCASMRFGASGSRASLGRTSAYTKSRSIAALAVSEATVILFDHATLLPRSRPNKSVKMVRTSVIAPTKSMRHNLDTRSEVSFRGSLSARETTMMATRAKGT